MMASSPRCAATQPSLTLISSSHGWVRFLMPLSVYAVEGGGLLIYCWSLKVSNIVPTAVASLSSPNEGKTNTSFTFSSFCWNNFSSIFLQWMFYHVTNLRAVLRWLSGCRSVQCLESVIRHQGSAQSSTCECLAVCVRLLSHRTDFLCIRGFIFFTASELLMGAHHEGLLTLQAGWEEPPSSLW